MLSYKEIKHLGYLTGILCNSISEIKVHNSISKTDVYDMINYKDKSCALQKLRLPHSMVS